MSTKAPPRDLATDISDLRKVVEQAAQSAQAMADYYEKNTDIQECVLLLQKALSCISDGDEVWPDPELKINWVAFGLTIKSRRKKARLGQKQLADLIDVSESMIRAIEGGQRRPSRRLLLRLLALSQLDLHLEDILGDGSYPGVIPTFWTAPHYDPRQLITDLVERLNGAGGSLEQSTAYLDYQSAADWLATCNAPNYLAMFSNNEALDAVAARIAEKCGAGGVDVIAIGCGDAKREVKFVECLLQHAARRNIKDIKLFLLDISHTLLTEGHNHAKAVLGGSVKKIFALHGNFHQLSQYPLFSPADMRSRCRVFTLLGLTLANLDNEVRFFRDTMNAAAPGDFFVADYSNAYAPPEEPERIRELDSPLQTGVAPAHQIWLGGPIQRYTKGARSVDFSVELNTDCVVRGSYELVSVAHATMEKGSQNRRFVVLRVRRYDPAQLEDCLARTGWAAEMRIPYGANERQNLTLSLLRKVA